MLRAVAGEGLVDGVVDDLPQAVHETARVGRADVHAGPLADRLEPFEHLEMVGGILGGHNLSRLSADAVGATRRHAARGESRVRAERNVMPHRGIPVAYAWLYVMTRTGSETTTLEEAPR